MIFFKLRKSQIYHAIWDRDCVALKVSVSNTDRDFNHEVSEIEILQGFAGSERIVQYYGSMIDHERHEVSIVMELGGLDLVQYIIDMKNQVHDFYELVKNVVIGAARALQECHQKNIIHLDIKPENFVISREQNSNSNEIVSKLIDFGFSIKQNTHLSGNRGTLGYIAPEFFRRNRNIGFKADVYSFGVLVYKLEHSLEDNIVSARRGTRLRFVDIHSQMAAFTNINEIGDGFNTTYKRLNHVIERCIENSPADRPQLRDVIAFLEGNKYDLY